MSWLSNTWYACIVILSTCTHSWSRRMYTFEKKNGREVLRLMRLVWDHFKYVRVSGLLPKTSKLFQNLFVLLQARAPTPIRTLSSLFRCRQQTPPHSKVVSLFVFYRQSKNVRRKGNLSPLSRLDFILFASRTTHTPWGAYFKEFFFWIPKNVMSYLSAFQSHVKPQKAQGTYSLSPYCLLPCAVNKPDSHQALQLRFWKDCLKAPVSVFEQRE